MPQPKKKRRLVSLNGKLQQIVEVEEAFDVAFDDTIASGETTVQGAIEWLAANSGGGEDLAATLALGNTTGGNNIVIDTSDEIQGDNGTLFMSDVSTDIKLQTANDLYLSAATVNIGEENAVTGILHLHNSSNTNYVGFTAPTTPIASYVLSMPLAAPTSYGYASALLTSDGTGNLSWTDVASLATGTVTSVAVSSTDLSVSGSPITTSGTFTLNVNTNAITYAKFQQVAALSVVGNGTNALANASAITGTANQVLVVNGAGTSLAFGQVNLSSPSARTGTLPATNGGTGKNTWTTGELIQATAANTLSALASVSAGSYLRSGGVTTASLWSTLKLPNTATQYYIPYPATSNNYNESSNLQFDGTNLSIGGASSGHRMEIIAGTLADAKYGLRLTATMPAVTTATAIGVSISLTSAGSSSNGQRGISLNLADGYTGSSQCEGINGTNAIAGATGTLVGITGVCNGTRSTGVNIGAYGWAYNSITNVGGRFFSATNKNSGNNVGTVCYAYNGGTSPYYSAGQFSISTSFTIQSVKCALYADNTSYADTIFIAADNSVKVWSIEDGGHTTWADAVNMVLGTTTGTKIGTATTQKIGIWNATPIVQPTTAVAAATFVANTSAIADDTATFDGYTIGQVVKALRNFGLLA